MYDDVIPILEKLKIRNKTIVAASRTYQSGWVQDLLNHFDIDKYFDLKEIYPASKLLHFNRIQKYFSISYLEMVFFDDEYRNIEEVGELVVQTFMLKTGLILIRLLSTSKYVIAQIII